MVNEKQISANGGQDPCTDIDQIQGLQCMEVSKYGIDPDNAENYGSQNDDQGRFYALSKASCCGSGIIHKSRNTVAQAHDRDTDTCIFHYIRITGKQ